MSLLICLIFIVTVSAQKTQTGASPANQIGNLNAKIVLEVFNDYQCPTCATSNERIKALRTEHPNDVLIIYRHFPLPMHNHSLLAAQVVEAAAMQGKFWEMTDLIFQEQKKWADSKIAGKKFYIYAKKLGLNGKKYKADLQSSEVLNRINADIERGRFLKVSWTPTVLFNEKSLSITEILNLEETLFPQENK